jgi:hypothetical protein
VQSKGRDSGKCTGLGCSPNCRQCPEFVKHLRPVGCRHNTAQVAAEYSIARLTTAQHAAQHRMLHVMLPGAATHCPGHQHRCKEPIKSLHTKAARSTTLSSTCQKGQLRRSTRRCSWLAKHSTESACHKHSTQACSSPSTEEETQQTRCQTIASTGRADRAFMSVLSPDHQKRQNPCKPPETPRNPQDGFLIGISKQLQVRVHMQASG